MKEIILKIKKDGIGILPTDTLYGIVGSAFSRRAVERIYEVKNRNPKKALIILISSIKDLEKFGIKINKELAKILEKFWPGKVSVILPCPYKKFEYLHRGTKSLAFRLPNKKFLLEILKKTGPLVAPSANPEGFIPAENITEAKKYFGDSVDFYISEGKKNGKASKLISIDKYGAIEILRA